MIHKTMKQIKFFSLMLIVAMAIVFTSCTDMQRLKLDVAASDADCPYKVEEGTVMTKIQMHGDYVEYVYQSDEIDEDGEEFSVADLNDPEIMKGMKEYCIKDDKEKYNTDEDIREFYKLCKKCKVGIEHRYIGKRTGAECTIRIEYWELP